jgi:hypothetical protein
VVPPVAEVITLSGCISTGGGYGDSGPKITTVSSTESSIGGEGVPTIGVAKTSYAFAKSWLNRYSSPEGEKNQGKRRGGYFHRKNFNFFYPITL